MPLAGKELHRIDLSDGEWVDVLRRLSLGDLENLETGEEGISAGRAQLVYAIKDWNMPFEEGGDSAPLTPENIALLSAADATTIIQELNRLNGFRKAEETANLSEPSPSTSRRQRRSQRRTTPK